MEIYIKIELPDVANGSGWYVDDKDSGGCGSYIADGDFLIKGTNVPRGTAASSWRQARTWANVARALCFYYGKYHLSFWSFRRGELVRVADPRKSRKSSH